MEFEANDEVYKINSCGDIIAKDIMRKWINTKTTCPKCGTDLSKVNSIPAHYNAINAFNNPRECIASNAFNSFHYKPSILYGQNHNRLLKMPVIKQYDPLSNSFVSGAKNQLIKLHTPSGFYKRY